MPRKEKVYFYAVCTPTMSGIFHSNEDADASLRRAGYGVNNRYIQTKRTRSRVRAQQWIRAKSCADDLSDGYSVYTDGSLINRYEPKSGKRTRYAGIGVWFSEPDKQQYNISRCLWMADPFGCGYVELSAVIAALTKVYEVYGKCSKVYLHSDYMLLVNYMQRGARWDKKRATPYRHQDKLDGIETMVLSLRQHCGIEVVFRHSPGHSGIEGNCKADRLAYEAAIKAQQIGYPNCCL